MTKGTSDFGPDDLLGDYLAVDFQDALDDQDSSVATRAVQELSSLLANLNKHKVPKSTLMAACFISDDHGIDVIVECPSTHRRLAWAISPQGETVLYQDSKKKPYSHENSVGFDWLLEYGK
jgi:hypothetical protein